MEPSVEEIQEILQIFLESPMQEIHLELGDVKVLASKRGAVPAVADERVPAPVEPVALARDAKAGTEPPEKPAEPEPEPEPEPVASAASPDRAGLVEVTAPLLGTFYRCPAPGQPPFVDVGSEVGPEDPVCIVEVMKLFNRVPAGKGGTVREIVVEDGAMVEFGQTLMWLEPAGAVG
ncbi:MAG: acetyl-CoA carboxylase biotin carboxyl carrier protein [Streptosporangiales bacterium]